MKTLVISQRAEEDLAEIYAFLASGDEPESAERFRSQTEKALLQLASHPEVGPHPGWSTRHKSLRFWIISRSHYVIYYEFRGQEVFIERVLDGRRDVHRIVELKIEQPPESEG